MLHNPRKRFGQNFLRDEMVIDAIAQAINACDQDHVAEIGPGLGALTQVLISSGCRLDAIELDRDLRTQLLAAFALFPRFTLHSGDALKFNFRDLIEDTESLRIVGNLPYNISTPLILKLLENIEVITDMHFMLQLEVVERITARPGNKNWGRLGVISQFHCEVEPLLIVPPEAFSPPPKVQSALVRLTPYRSNPYSSVDRSNLIKTVARAFSQRRKTLRNNFKGLLTDNDLQKVDIDPGTRAETLSIEDFIALSSLTDNAL